MTVILKREEFRNSGNDATIIVEKYQEKESAVPLWRYYIRYDGQMISGMSDCLWNRPNKKWLQNRF